MTTPISVDLTAGSPQPDFRDVVHAEWIKLRSVRSTYWALIVAALLSLGMGPPIVTWVLDATPQRDWASEIDPVAVTYGGFHISIVVFGIVGVLAVTNEYASGMIRLTQAATPRRLHVLAAKAVTVAAITLPAATIVSVATFLLGQQVLADKGLDVGLTDPGVPRAVAGAGLFAAAVAVMGVALGALIRNAVGANTIVVFVLFVPQILWDLLPASWSVTKFVPHWAGYAIFTLEPDSDMLAPWFGFAVFSAYVAVLLGAAALLLQRRDT
jgi:ABC-type transport system involved in multi-copper enzyme maturation permease subunit